MYLIIYLYSAHDFKFTNNGLIETVNLDSTEHLLIMIKDILKELGKIKNTHKIFWKLTLVSELLKSLDGCSFSV